MTFSEVIYKALKNPKWTFRTIDGLSKETGFDPEDVEIYLRLLNQRSKVQWIYTDKGLYYTTDISAAHKRMFEEQRKNKEKLG